jgi:hypothetical protein
MSQYHSPWPDELKISENLFEMSDLFSSLLIFKIIKTILNTFYLLFTR